MNNDLQKMFLILAGAAAIGAGKLADKRSMQDINQASKVELVSKTNLNQGATELTTQKCQIIQEKAEKIFINLKIENTQEKSVEEQERTAFQLLKYVIYNTENDYTQKIRPSTNQFENEIDLIYHSLCEGKNLTPEAQSLTLNFLFQMCGLESQHVVIQRDAYKLTKSGKKPTTIQHDVVLVNLGENQKICDPDYTKTMQGPLLRDKNPHWWSAAFIQPQYYFEKIKPGYQLATALSDTNLSTALIQTTANNDNTMER